jgi:hypothetical protein
MKRPMMPRHANFLTSITLALLAICGAGCHGPWSVGHLAQSQEMRRSAPDSAKVITNKPDSDQELATHEEAMASVLDQLQEIEAIDPAAKEELLSDLKAAKPENWPLIVQQFQSALAYRQQLAAKEKLASRAMPAPEGIQEQLAQMQKALSDQRTHQLAPQPATKLKATAFAARVADNQSAVAVDLSTPEPTVSSPRTQQHTITPAEHPVAIKRVGYVTPEQEAAPWQDHLDRAIAELERSTLEPPGSTEDVQQHMRLRLLRQLAGQDEQALSPIVGASPAMQDYWSKQMFAIATFLDNQRQPDDKRRAAGSLLHLDQARAKLSELATLQIRNLTFVESVDGYGVYQQREATKFQPGQQVSLYGEIENFQSASTKTGHRTLLATSYEVVDLNGQRVDGREFPEVEDFCQNVRRDFHIQYGIDLPTRIYPGKYELRFVVTDRLSHKIGQASVPFEIVE